MRHEDGFCDACGAALEDSPVQLTVDGLELCSICAAAPELARHPRHPEARDDGK